MPSSTFSPTIFGPSNLVELVRYRAAAQPDDLAFVYLANGVDDEIPLTNEELDRKAREIGAWLQSQNMLGERVLLLYPPGLDFITAFFGCLYAGAIAVPVYPPRKNRSMLRIQAVAQSAEAKIALTTEDTLVRVHNFIEDAPDLKNILWLATDSLQPGFEEKWFFPDIDEKSLAFLQYTSGSTGAPKGVILSHGNLIHNSRLIQLGFEHTRHDLGVFWLPSYHDMGLIGGILQPIFCGRTNVLMSPLSFLQKAYRWLAAITRYRGTTSGGPNFAYDLCVRQIKDEQLDELDLSSWKVAFNGAEPVQAETMEAFARKFERCGFKYEAFYPCYGLAEATLIVSGGYVSDPPIVRSFDSDALAVGKAVEVEPIDGNARRLVSSGRNFIDQTVKIVNPETSLECPDETVGEIWVKGPSIAQGYWNAADTTETVFRAKIRNNGLDSYMRTGDLGFLVEGELFVTGRIKDLIIIRGVNVYPQDIEATVQKSDPNLRVNCGGAVMISDGLSERLVIVQEVERRFKGDLAPIFEEVRRTVSLEHEIAVASIVLVKSGSIPKTSSGKIQRHACRQGFLDGTLAVIEYWNAFNSPIAFAPAASGETDETDPGENAPAKAEEPPQILQVPAPSASESNPPQPLEPVLKKSESVQQPETRSPDHSFAESLRKEKEEAEKQQFVGTVSRTDLLPAARKTTEKASLENREEVTAVVLEEVRNVAKERAAGLTLETDITELGLDSLERMEILASLEDRFGGQFPEQVLPELFTARQVVDAVVRYLGAGPKPQSRTVQTAGGEIAEDRYVFSQFPEYQKLKGGLDLIRTLGLNHFFDVHEGITNDRTMIGGKEYINFSSYNYVNTSGDPDVVKAAQDACAKFGTSVSASRMVSGEKPLHRELEQEISRFLGTEDTIVLVSGHATNESVIGHLLGAEDMILHDSLAHNSIVQGAILSGARRRPFPHNDWEAADWILKKHRGEYRRVMMIIEGVYSMDGDYPELPKFIDIKKRHKTLLMIDEAHSIGVLGKTGRGIGEHFEINRADVDLWMCTLSKTFGSCGGYISGCKELVEYLKYTAPGFVFSVGLSPPNAAAALASLQVLEREPQRVEQLRKNSALFVRLAKEKGLNTGMSRDSAVVPAIIGNSMLCLQLSKALFDRGINVQPILHPAVEEKAARLRFFITSAHNKEQIRLTVEATVEELAKLTI